MRPWCLTLSCVLSVVLSLSTLPAHAQETTAMVESFRRMGVIPHLGSDTTGLLESEAGP